MGCSVLSPSTLPPGRVALAVSGSPCASERTSVSHRLHEDTLLTAGLLVDAATT